VSYNFRPVNRNQLYLMPPSLRDWLPQGHLAWFLIDAVDQMDLTSFRLKYRADGWGGESYDPAMMVTLLLYAYCLGERSSRRIERLCVEDVAFRVITANQMPDHVTIARFRQRHQKDLADLFVQVLRLCQEAGLVKVGTVALDGTKVKANASLAANRSYEHIRQEVEKMLGEAEAADREEDGRHGPVSGAMSCLRTCATRRAGWSGFWRASGGWSRRRPSVRRRSRQRWRSGRRRKRPRAGSCGDASPRRPMPRWMRRPRLTSPTRTAAS